MKENAKYLPAILSGTVSFGTVITYLFGETFEEWRRNLLLDLGLGALALGVVSFVVAFMIEFGKGSKK